MDTEEIAAHEKYRERYHHDRVCRSLKEVPTDASWVNFWRKKDSHRGINTLEGIKHLTATSVNQSFLDEICQLESLDSLILNNVDVSDLSGLRSLQNLRYLKLIKLQPCNGLDCLIQLPRIEKLWINESKNITDYSFLTGAKSLIALGVEGDIWTKQKVESLAPFVGLEKLEALFLSSVQLKDKDLTYVAENMELRYFAVARFAPKKSFQELRKIRPDLICQWFDNYEI